MATEERKTSSKSSSAPMDDHEGILSTWSCSDDEDYFKNQNSESFAVRMKKAKQRAENATSEIRKRLAMGYAGMPTMFDGSMRWRPVAWESLGGMSDGEGPDPVKQVVERAKSVAAETSDGIRRRVKDVEDRVNASLKDVGDQTTRKVRKFVTGDEKERIRTWRRQVKVAKLLDKWSFSIGVFMMLGVQAMLIRFPEYFWILFCAFFPLIYLQKWIMYKPMKYHFFLVDFCYFVNAGLVVHVLLFSKNCTLLKMCYMGSLGSCANAVWMWRNSVVFHDVDKMSSLYLHVLPMFMSTCARYYPTSPDAAACAEDEPFGLDGFAYGLVFQLVWQAMYLILTCHICKHHFDEDPEVTSSMRWMMVDEKSGIMKATRSFWRKYGIMGPDEVYDVNSFLSLFTFVVCQSLFAVILSIPVGLWWSNWWASTIFQIWVVMMATFSGANFYIEVHSVSYMQRLQKAESAARKQDAEEDSK